MIIPTERLFIEPLSTKEAPFIFELVTTKEWIKYIGDRNINNEDDAKAYIEKTINNRDTSFWTVSLKDTKTSIGVITLIKRDYLDSPDIGFAFLPAFFNKGYAYEATHAVIQHYKENEGLNNIIAITLPENTTSIKLLKKLGLTFIKTIHENNEELYMFQSNFNS